MKKLKEIWEWLVATVLAVLALAGAWALTRNTKKPVPGKKRLMEEIAEEQEREAKVAKKKQDEEYREAVKDATTSTGDGSYLFEFYGGGRDSED